MGDGRDFSQLPPKLEVRQEEDLVITPEAMMEQYGIMVPYKLSQVGPATNLPTFDNILGGGGTAASRGGGGLGFFSACMCCRQSEEPEIEVTETQVRTMG